MKKLYCFLVGEDADLPEELIRDLPIITYPFTVVDGKTSQPSSDIFVEKIRECLESYENLILVTISSELSGTYNSAIQALRRLATKDQRQVTVIDSGLSTGGVGLAVLLSLKSFSLSFSRKSTMPEWVRESKIPDQVRDDVVRDLQKNLKNAHVIGTFDDPQYLQKGGRINKIQSLLVQNMIKAGIRPMLCIKEKKIGISKVSRPGSTAVSALVDVFLKENSGVRASQKTYIAITHAGCLTDATDLSQELHKKFNSIETVYIHELAPVLQAHLGPGALLVSWIQADS